MEKKFKGKAIYCPSGKAKEYSYWACNFYTGCSNGCTYCYLKKGRGAKLLGGNKPTLKKCFKNGRHAIDIFKKELNQNLPALKENGLFFSFTTDPMLKETVGLTLDAVYECRENNVPVKILTKNTSCLDWFVHECRKYYFDKSKIAIGFTLTGHDELEPNASTNKDRVFAMSRLKKEGYRTFASIEPIIDFESAKGMIGLSAGFCDIFKVGLESGKKYNTTEAISFVSWLDEYEGPKIYMKESLQKLTGKTNSDMDEYFVERDYKIFQ